MALLRAAFHQLLYDVCAGEKYVNKCGDRLRKRKSIAFMNFIPFLSFRLAPRATSLVRGRQEAVLIQ